MDTLNELLECLRSWDPDVRVLGNIQAGPAADALEAMLDKCNCLTQAHRELRNTLCTVRPRLNETECECGDDGVCDKHLVSITLANCPKR